MPQFHPGVHFEPIRHDLADLADRTRQLIEEAGIDPSRLERMATAAMEQAVEVLSALSQVDSAAWALARAAEASTTSIAAPETEVGWEALKLPPTFKMTAPFMEHHKRRVIEAMPHHFAALLR
jgi:hypothetical protein